MRVPDCVLKSVGVVARAVSFDALDDLVSFDGTGFTVRVPSEVISGHTYDYFVTAKHVVDPIIDHPVAIVANGKDGHLVRLNMIGGWFFHPIDAATDVAVHPFQWMPDLDLLAIPPALFLTPPESLDGYRFGIGDDLYMPGLFGEIAGFKNLHSIVRHGTIAMLPSEQIQATTGFTDLYLIEARSTGGISGSPVFVRPTVSWKSARESEWLDGLGRRQYLIGMARGHWDIDESKKNSYHAMHDEGGINMGIAIVTPAYKIMETINHPNLVLARKLSEDALRGTVGVPEGR